MIYAPFENTFVNNTLRTLGLNAHPQQAIMLGDSLDPWRTRFKEQIKKLDDPTKIKAYQV